MSKLLMLFTLTALSLVAPDATGTWIGKLTPQSPDGASEGRPALLVLKQDGAKLTGTAGPDASEQYPIEGGKAESGRLTFQANSMNFDLKQDGDEISGEITRERDGATQRAKLAVKRQK